MFKIRKKFFPEIDYEFFEQKYINHLQKKRKFLDDDLLRMFENDCFHDGSLSGLLYDYKNGFVKIYLSSPNFVDESGSCINVEFILNFYNIDYFQIKKMYKTEIDWRSAIFLHSELGSLACSDKKISLIMSFMTNSPRSEFFIEIICKKIEIIPREELCFNYLKNSGKIRLLTE